MKATTARRMTENFTEPQTIPQVFGLIRSLARRGHCNTSVLFPRETIEQVDHYLVIQKALRDKGYEVRGDQWQDYMLLEIQW